MMETTAKIDAKIHLKPSNTYDANNNQTDATDGTLSNMPASAATVAHMPHKLSGLKYIDII